MKLPDNVMNSSGGNTIDMSGLESGIKRVKKAIQEKKLVAFNVDQRGRHLAEETYQVKVKYYASLVHDSHFNCQFWFFVSTGLLCDK